MVIPLSKRSRLMKGIPAEHKDRQKSIPVGCVPPAFVVLGVGYIPPLDSLPIGYPIPGCPIPWMPYPTYTTPPGYPTPTLWILYP